MGEDMVYYGAYGLMVRKELLCLPSANSAIFRS